MATLIAMKNTVRYQYLSLIDKLVLLRQERKISQETLAMTIGINTKLFGQWEQQNAPKDWQGKEASDILNDMMDKQIKHSFN